jgi:predicted kinase
VTSIEILRGYSASGKSTYARESGKFIVSRDLIRQQFGATMKTVFGQETEAKVSKIQEAQVRTAISAGMDVVIDDTNLVLKFARRWADLAVELGVPWSVRDFKPDVTNVQAWNDRRSQQDHVPYSVIDSQAARFPYKKWQEVKPSPGKEPVVFTPYVPDETLPEAVGFDLDGTLAHMTGRSPYDESRYHEDEVDENLRELAWDAYGKGYKVIVFSGRSDAYRRVCRQWLDDMDFPYNCLLVMRKAGDKRRDDIVKSELFDEFIAPNYNFLYHFDDRDRVVKGLRSKGITVYQVCEGNY